MKMARKRPPPDARASTSSNPMPATVLSATSAIAAMTAACLVPTAQTRGTNKKWAEAHLNQKRLEV
jgi:hypothetical protein